MLLTHEDSLCVGGRARRGNKGAAPRALVCTSMESEPLPTMPPILKEHALSCRKLLGSRPPEMDRHQTEPVPTQTERGKKVRQHLLGFVREESFKAKPNERLVGSSEVLESVFGRFKQLEHDQVKSGFTGLLLSLAALVSTTTTEVIQTALETVRTKQVTAWCNNTLGKSVQAQRREVLIAPQNRNKNGTALVR